MKNPVSSPQNSWFDSQEVDNINLDLEQDYNNTVQSAIIANNIGTGVIPEVLTQNILFDSSLVTGFLDGKPISPQNQPVDNTLGNQLEVELTDSGVFGKRTVKVCIIGLDFGENIQFETFQFKRNESQVSKKHFAKILTILFNDVFGEESKSFNLGGKVVIKEAKPMTLSRDAVMVAQDFQPNLFFRDFFLDGFNSLDALLQSALPLYNIDDLNIKTSELDNKILAVNDITTQIGQKFVATTNNIQKITLLLSVRNLDFGNEDDLNWTGDIIISVYPLQSIIECSSDIAPNLPIEFSPSNIPLAQLSINYSSLQDNGVILDSVPQPVDFVFSNTPIANGNIITEGNYYAVALKRAGSADKCDILIANGGDLVEDSRITTFTGTLWVDLPEEDLWFKIYTDSAKVSDGQAYDSGNGIAIEKTIIKDSQTIDYCLDNLNFSGNNVFKAVVQATTANLAPIPDTRTGDNVFSQKQFVPDVKLLNSIDIGNLEAVSDPLIIGAIADKNKKFYNAVTSTINSKLYSSTIVNNEIVIKIIDDPTDAVRFDSSVSTLGSNLLNGDFVNAKFIPNITEPNVYYRIASSSLCSMLFGDVNGDGIIDELDVALLNSYIGYDMNVGLLEDSVITTDGYTTTFTNGYSNLTKPFTTSFSIPFQVVNTTTNAVLASGTDGILVKDPNDKRLARFTSASVSFTGISNLSNHKLVLLNPAILSNFGGFDITAVDANDIISIRKIYLDSESMKQMLRADIDGDFHVTDNDGYLLQSYIDRLNLENSPTPPYPAPSSNAYDKIGKRFNLISFKLEKYIDRDDDYTASADRNEDVHTIQNILSDGYVDGYQVARNYYSSPVSFSIQKKFTWDESLIVASSDPRFVPNVFNYSSGYIENSCDLNGILCNIYPANPEFDPGKVDYFIPNNLIVGDGGEFLRPDGTFYKTDYEIGTIVLEIPDGLFGTEQIINLVDDFIADYNGEGITRLGFKAMRFADCSFVATDALSKNQIRFSAAIQSFSPNTNGISEELLSGPIVDGKMGVSIDYETGVLTINFTNLYQDSVMKTLSTKIQITVFLKKAGFNNTPIFVDSTKVNNLLELTSIYSGGGTSGIPAITVDLTTDVTNVGQDGYTLVSDGDSLVYRALNPVYFYGVAGNHTTTSATLVELGAFSFNINSISPGFSSIVLEVILQTSSGANAAEVALYNETTAAYVNLDGVTQNLSTSSTSSALLKSSDLSTTLGLLSQDYIYSVRVLVPGGSTATCKQARLAVIY